MKRKLWVRSLEKIKNSDLSIVVSSLSYSSILSLIPFVAILLAAFKMVGGLESYYPKVEALVLQNLNVNSSEMVLKYFHKALGRIHAGKLGTYGVIFLLFTSFKLLVDIDSSVQRVWHIKDERRFHQRFLKSWLMLLLIPLILAVYVAIVTMQQDLHWKASWIKDATGFSFLFVFVFLIYKFIPNTRVDTNMALKVTGGVTFAVIISKAVLTFLVTSFFRYDKIYGSLAAIPVLFIWVSMIWTVLLGGVAVLAVLHEDRPPDLQKAS